MSKFGREIQSISMSQQSRINPALAPDFMQIDSRSKEELLIYIDQLSDEINFYNSENEIQGTWDDLLLAHPTINCIIADRFTKDTVKELFNHHQKRIRDSVSEEVKLEHIHSLFQFLAKLSRICQLQIELFENHIQLIKDDFQPFYLLEKSLQLLRSNYGNKPFQNIHTGVFSSSFNVPEITNTLGETDFKSIEKNDFLLLYKIAHGFVWVLDRLKLQRSKYIETHPLETGELEPQIGIIMSFIGLYKTIQEKANSLNKKHLDFYYTTLLQYEKQDQRADSAILILEPEGDAKPIHLKMGHRFLGISPHLDERIEYNLVDDTTITKGTIAKIISLTSARVVKLKSKHLSELDLVETELYCSEPLHVPPVQVIANKKNNPAWNAFYRTTQISTAQQASMKFANTGLLVSSSLLSLPSGNREIHISFELKSSTIISFVNFINEYATRSQKSLQASTNEILTSAFILSYSGPEGWVDIPEYYATVKVVGTDNLHLDLTITLDESRVGIMPCKPIIHELFFACDRPAIKILASPHAEISPGSFLTETNIERISIQTNVTNFKALALQNQLGALSADNPFLLFGPLPQPGSFFQFNNPQAINRYTNQLCLNFTWLGLPTCEGGFKTHYENYGKLPKESDFLVRISSVSHGKTSPEIEARDVFPIFYLDTETNRTSSHTHVDIANMRHLNLMSQNKGISGAFETLTTGKEEEALRIELISPTDGFGQNTYSRIFPEIVIHNSNKWKKKKALPNLPLTPLVESFSINYGQYVSEKPDEIQLNENKTIQLFHLHPFGYEDLNQPQAGTVKHFLPPQPDGGNLLIGLKNHEPGSFLHLYFLLDEQSYHHTGHSEGKLNWSYLDGNTWMPISEKNLISDSTYNLICSGIVVVKSPAHSEKKTTILDPDLFWIKIQTSNPQLCNPRIISVFANALVVQRNRAHTIPVAGPIQIAFGAIQESFEGITGVSAIHQIADSFNGQKAESDLSYYQRVSERLSHQNRPIRPQDYIEMILERFPEILIVKCFHTTYDDYVITPGVYLHFILVPHFTGEILTSQSTPLVSLKTMVEIKQFLKQYVSPFVRFEVGNPVYEQIKVVGKIKLSTFAQDSGGKYLERFISELNNYISPWQSGDESSLQLGSKIYLTDLLNFIKSRSYIDYISGFSVVHLYNHRNILNNELESHAEDTFYNAGDYISGTAPYAILIPSLHHLITLIDDDMPYDTQPTGIGQFIIGEELLLQEENWQNIPNENVESTNDEDEFSIFISYQ
ncbi:MAG: hypothetical protein ACKVOK_04020 [Flavobacteriales bacterium]